MPFRVGEWRVDPEDLSLEGEGTNRRLEPKVMALLVQLAEAPGQVVRREALLEALWPDVVVGDDTLARLVSKLRKALADDPKQPRYVETIPKRGYRLVSSVTETPTPAIEVAAPAPTRPKRGRLYAAALAVAVVVVGLALSLGASPKPSVDLDRADDLYMRFTRADNEAALALYQKVLAEDGQNARALAGVANALVQRVIRWPSRPGAPPEGATSVTAALKAGLHRTPKGRAQLERALDHARRAVAHAPRSAHSHKALGLVLSTQGQLAAAAETYRQAIAVDARAWAPHVNLGEIELMNGRLDAAAEHFERAFELMETAYPDEPQRIGPWLGAVGVEVGRVHGQRGDKTRAERWYRRVLEIVPFHPPATGQLASLLAGQGRLAAAWALCEAIAERVALPPECEALTASASDR